MLDDITPDGLVIRDTKFGKTRMVALHPTSWKALNLYLEAYASGRQRRIGTCS